MKQLIYILLLLCGLCLCADISSWSCSVEDGDALAEVVDEPVSTTRSKISGGTFERSPLPVLPDGELLTTQASSHWVYSCRLNRTLRGEAHACFKSLLKDLSRYVEMLSLHAEASSGSTAFRAVPLHPVCKYYVFALRHIII